ncbi:hypothetical protein MBLNU230_g1170t1 [Neophaeotheca triangularis]
MAEARKPLSPPYVSVAIIGAGESGIAMGAQLKQQLGCTDFRIFDRQAGIGGTWHINQYPGVACDVPAVFYSFSFAMNPNWTSLHPSGPEIKKYMTDVCEKYGMLERIQLNTDVSVCRWKEDVGLWELELRHFATGMGDLSEKDRRRITAEKGEDVVVLRRETIHAKVVCSCVGGLVEPRAKPEEVQGWEGFEGEVFHSARWKHDVDFNDKNVVVLGTGCSAAQIVPNIVKEPYNAKKVTQLMRSPPWVVQRPVPPGGEEWWSKNGPTLMTWVPGLNRLMRQAIFMGAEQQFMMFRDGGAAEAYRAKYEAKLIRHLKRTVPEKYQEMLTPDYGVGCKRRIFDAAWLPSLNNEKIELTTKPLTKINKNSVTIGPGRTYPDPANTAISVGTDEEEVPADIIVLSNGFDTTRWLHPITVLGRDNVDLVEEMDRRGGAQAYQGTAMDGFPNFFLIFGPNTATGHSSVILATENMVNYALRFIRYVLADEARTVEVKQEAEVKYTRDLQEALSKTVWMSGGCNSWYFTKDGWNSTVYPHTQYHFGWRCLFPRWKDWDFEYTRKGLWMGRLRVLRRVVELVVFFGWAYRARRVGGVAALLEGWNAVKDVGLRLAGRAAA